MYSETQLFSDCGQIPLTVISLLPSSSCRALWIAASLNSLFGESAPKILQPLLSSPRKGNSGSSLSPAHRLTSISARKSLSALHQTSLNLFPFHSVECSRGRSPFGDRTLPVGLVRHQSRQHSVYKIGFFNSLGASLGILESCLESFQRGCVSTL